MRVQRMIMCAVVDTICALIYMYILYIYIYVLPGRCLGADAHSSMKRIICSHNIPYSFSPAGIKQSNQKIFRPVPHICMHVLLCISVYVCTYASSEREIFLFRDSYMQDC